jgi:hypothetical protein
MERLTELEALIKVFLFSVRLIELSCEKFGDYYYYIPSGCVDLPGIYTVIRHNL